MGKMSNVLKIDSEFDQAKVVLGNFLSIRQGNDLIALYKDEAVKLAEWILKNIEQENDIEKV